MESLWGEFFGARAVGNHPVPFLDAFPLTLWVHIDPFSLTKDRSSNLADIHVMTCVSNLISLQINKHQTVFLTKIAKQFSEVWIDQFFVSNYSNNFLTMQFYR